MVMEMNERNVPTTPIAYGSSMDYTIPTELEWNLEKSERCELHRGFNFEYAARVFWDPKRLTVEDKRFDYGERRYQSTGKIDGRIFVLVYCIRGQTTRIISARKANKREVKRYENHAIQT